MSGADLLRRLSRFELKMLALKLAETTGPAALQGAIAQITEPRKKASDEEDGAAAASASPRAAPPSQALLEKKEHADRQRRIQQEKQEQNRALKASGAAEEQQQKKKKRKAKRPFEMGCFSQRHIALHVAYFGESYRGFASQDAFDDTVEFHLFKALEKCKLIVDRKSAMYSRCGRTDATVSALGQIVTLTVRSALKSPQPAASAVPATIERKSKRPREESEAAEGATAQTAAAQPAESAAAEESDADELNYPLILNKNLPADIMVLGWAPAPEREYQARFNAESRTYHYYFSRRALDLEAMRKAASFLEGAHDFRNFCKMDVTNVKNFKRAIAKIKILELEAPESAPLAVRGMCCLRVEGSAFLWHQIRCIVAVLLLVGEGLEKPELVQDMLDIDKMPRKPCYEIARGEPLILYESEYPLNDLRFRYDANMLNELRQRLEGRLAEHAIAAEMTRGVIDFIDNRAVLADGPEPGATLASAGLVTPLKVDFQERRPRGIHVPLAQRPTCDSYDEKVISLSDKRREVVRRRHGWEL